MPASYVTYQAVGDSYLFPIPFPYLNPAYIKVSTPSGVKQADLDYIVEGVNVRFLKYKPVGTVTIRRETPITGPIVPFADGSLLNARVLSSASSQALQGLEETRDYIDAVKADLIANLTPADSPVIASQLTGMQASLDNVSASISNEQAVRATSDDAMAYVINQITAATGGAQALSQTGGSYSATWTAAQANYWNDLRAEVFTSGGTTIRAALAAEATTRASADSAMATNITSLTSRIGAAESAITTEQTTRASADSSLASEISSLKSRMGSAESAITTEQTTRASADSANASSITSLTTRMNNAESSITTEASTRATETGALKAQYTVKLDMNGYVAGFGLASEGTVAGGTTSAFTILADKFKVTVPGMGSYTPFSVGASAVTFTGNTNWSNVRGSGKPLDGAGRVIDGGTGTGPGQRQCDDPPNWYPVGKTLQFKWGDSLGITGAGWITLETNKHYGDNTGGMLTQWAFGLDGKTWKRSGWPAGGGWTTAWAQDLDRNLYTGALNATYGADASNLDVGLGVNLLANTEFIGGTGTAVLGWNPGGTSALYVLGGVNDNWGPRGCRTLQSYLPGRSGNQWNIGCDVYMTGGYGSATTGIPVTPGKRYEFSAKTASHRCDVELCFDFFDASNNNVGAGRSGWVSRRSGGNMLGANSNGNGWGHNAAFATAPANAAYASVFWRRSDTDSGQWDSYAWLTQPFFGEATPAQTVPSTYSPGYARGAMANIDKLTAANIATFMDNAIINNALIGDAQITSAKILDASVGTLKIAGEAVTVPRSAYTAAAYDTTSVGSAFYDVQTCYIDAAGASVMILGGASMVNYSGVPQFALRIVSPSGAILSESFSQPAGDSNGTASASMFVGAVSNEVGTYKLQARTGSSLYGASVSNRFLSLLATKR